MYWTSWWPYWTIWACLSLFQITVEWFRTLKPISGRMGGYLRLLRTPCGATKLDNVDCDVVYLQKNKLHSNKGQLGTSPIFPVIFIDFLWTEALFLFLLFWDCFVHFDIKANYLQWHNMIFGGNLLGLFVHFKPHWNCIYFYFLGTFLPMGTCELTIFMISIWIFGNLLVFLSIQSHTDTVRFFFTFLGPCCPFWYMSKLSMGRHYN